MMAAPLFTVAPSADFGSRGIVRGWPFACCPRFAWNPGSQVESMETAALTPKSEVVFRGTPDLHQTIKYRWRTIGFSPFSAS